MPMSPGTYLEKRRLAARLTIDDLAVRLAALPSLSGYDPAKLRSNLARAELSEGFFEGQPASMLARVLPFDPEIYAQLVDLHSAGLGDSGTSWGLPVPTVCRRCACSWANACSDASGPCSWSDSEADLCTRCETLERVIASADPQSSEMAETGEPA